MPIGRVVFVVSLTLAVALSIGHASAQKESSSRLNVGIVPFNGGRSARVSQHNATVLANQLGAELSQSGRVRPRVLTVPAGTKLPLPSAKVSEIGRGAGVDVVIVPTVSRVVVTGAPKGRLGRLGRLRNPLGERAPTASAEVALQVELIRSKDSSPMDSFTVKGKNTESGPKSSVGNYNDLGSADAGSPDFRNSALGQAMHEALAHLAAQVEARTERARSQPASPAVGGAESAPAVTEEKVTRPEDKTAGTGRGHRGEEHSLSGAPPPPPLKPPKDLYGPDSGASSRKQKQPGEGPETATARKPSAPPSGEARRDTAPAPSRDKSLEGFGWRPFSADQITTSGKERHKAKFYATERAFRMEAEEKGQKAITIMRTDRGVMWVLMPEQKMYMEMSLNLGKSFAEAARDPEAKVERESLGMEQIGPYHCEKHRVRMTYKGAVYTGLQWAAKELDGFVVKMVDEKTKATTEYENIRLGPQDPALFEIPPGYQKFAMPGMKFP